MVKVRGIWGTVAVAACALLAACEAPTTQRYAALADNTHAVRLLNVTGVAIGTFEEPDGGFSSACRALGPMRVADGLTHTTYIRKAFEEELKMAGAYAMGAPQVMLTGKVKHLEFSSMRAITGGSWTIDLLLASSNGAGFMVSEHYEFDSGFVANDACKNVAEAFSRATQNLVGRAVRHPSFAQLVGSSKAAARPSAPLDLPAAAAVAPATKSASPAIGTDTIAAARLTEARQCNQQPQPQPTLLSKGPGFESYTVACTNGDTLMVRCEFGNCRALR